MSVLFKDGKAVFQDGKEYCLHLNIVFTGLLTWIKLDTSCLQKCAQMLSDVSAELTTHGLTA